MTAHKVMDVSLLGELAASALTRASIPVSTQLQANGLPNTFVPGRNIVFLTLAGIYAYQVGAEVIITGVCETDFSGYPDCRNDFVQALNRALRTIHGREGEVLRITSYNVCYTKLLRFPMSRCRGRYERRCAPDQALRHRHPWPPR